MENVYRNYVKPHQWTISTYLL